MFSNPMIVPFVLLLIICAYLVYGRSKRENEIFEEYDKKFEEWKKYSDLNMTTKKEPKFGGVIFEDDDKVIFEVFNQNTKTKIENKNFEIKVR